jgi:hypothetical protein
MLYTSSTQSLQLCVRIVLSLFVLITAGTQTANAQIAKYAAIINDPNNYGWYLPDRYFLTYISSSNSFAKPAPVGDQTLWTNMRADPTTGVFTGRTVAVLAVGSGFTPPSPQTMLGIVDDEGRI